MPLWPHQSAAIDAAREQYAAGSRSILIVLPTGGGKTRVGVTIAQSSHGKGNRVIWTVHRAELVQQAAAELRSQGVACGIIAPWAPRTWEPVQVASIDTLIARNLRPAADVIVNDECHHIVAPTHIEVRRDYPDALVIGLTATPCRADGVGLRAAYQSMVATVQPRELIGAGHLVPAVVYAPAKALRGLAADPVTEYQARCAGRKAIVFCASVAAAQSLAREYCTAGIPARCVDGKMSDDDRAAAIAEFRAGKVQILTNMHVLTEGFDVREVSAIILARKVGSESAYIQMVGRGMRCAPGKVDCIVLDLCGSSHDLGILPDSDRLYSLDGAGLKSGDKVDQISQCAECGAWFRSQLFVASMCPQCGYVRPGKKDPRVVHAEMVQLQAAKLRGSFGQTRIAALRELLRDCAAKGHKPGSARMQYKLKFNHWPNEAMKTAAGWPTGQ